MDVKLYHFCDYIAFVIRCETSVQRIFYHRNTNVIITVFVRKNGAFHVTISADGNELKRKNNDFTRYSYAIHT